MALVEVGGGRFERRRNTMVDQQILGRGVRDARLIGVLRRLPREEFVPERLREFAYDDTPLPLGEGRAIAQPFVLARMIEALRIQPSDRVLAVGVGSGYAAAVLGALAAEVWAVDPRRDLVEAARERLGRLGVGNMHLMVGPGELGLPDHAPFDAILVTGAGVTLPEPLHRQLAPGGRLLLPVGESTRSQTLHLVSRAADGALHEQELGQVRFVPLADVEPGRALGPQAPTSPSELAARACEPFEDIDAAVLEPLLHRIGDARVVLLGEATHGTSEFYRFRSRLTQALIERLGFTDVAVEADWPDAARVDHYLRHLDRPLAEWRAFARYPTWMWRNVEFLDLVEWLREHNSRASMEDRVGFFGLDLYSLYTSIDSVVGYLERVDPDAAEVARERYGCLSGWESDPATYGRAAVTGAYEDCEDEVTGILRDLLDKRLDYARADGDEFLDAAANARLVKNAEQYYRAVYSGSRRSWNLRDTHMFETLQGLLSRRSGAAKVVVWAHNSHLGDARFTEMGSRGQHNIGQLCRQALGGDVYSIGFGTDRGTVAAADRWGGPMRIRDVRPSHPGSYERLFHGSGVGAFLLPLRRPHVPEVRAALLEPRLERAIGVIYRPETELQSHYFQAVLPRQFDEYVWLDETHAVTALAARHVEGMPETFPFGL